MSVAWKRKLRLRDGKQWSEVPQLVSSVRTWIQTDFFLPAKMPNA